MIIQISWKNVWRNRTRSLIIMIAILLGIFGGMFLLAFMQGMTEQRLSSALKTEVSHIQIHSEKYLENNDFNQYMTDISAIDEYLSTDKRVQGYSTRIIIYSLAKTSEMGAGVRITGVDPENEINVTDLNTKIIDGSYFENTRGMPIVIGEKLAKKLKAKVRKKIVLQVQDTSGKTFPSAFRVAGIYKTTNTAFDEMNVFVRNKDLRELTGFNENNAHEIAIYLNNRENVTAVENDLESIFPAFTVESWSEGNAILAYMSEAMDQYLIIFILIILFALFFGIANTMLMAILERRKELGMLMAIGMKRFKVFRMIMYETIFLSLVGAMLGIIIAFLTITYFAKNGLNLSIWSEGLEAIGYDPIVYFQLDTSYLLQIVVMVIITGILASILPAIKALKLNPADALRIDN
ncbi:MAG TPA: ABC transporter permease [Bacteroidales bacterium]|jgi:putative ABC transport system permease protein|nr:ABC transporter permease [Bacteroidales bacterium]